MSTPQITLYTAGTPNGHKASIALEYLGISYKVHKINMGAKEQKEEWFLKINPNGRIPVIVDHTNNDFAVFETGAIILYLAEKYDPQYKLLPKDANARSEVIQWLMWQMGGLGPMMGQATHFNRYANEKIPYAIERYKNETIRLFDVLETKLNGRNYLVDDQPTAADIACFPWVRAAFWAGVELSNYTNLNSWTQRLEALDFIQKGLNVPDNDTVKKLQNDPEFVKNKIKEVASISN